MSYGLKKSFQVIAEVTRITVRGGTHRDERGRKQRRKKGRQIETFARCSRIKSRDYIAKQQKLGRIAECKSEMT